MMFDILFFWVGVIIGAVVGTFIFVATGGRKEHHDSSFCGRSDTDFKTPLRKFILEAVEKVELNYFWLKGYPRLWKESLAQVLSFALKMGAVSKGDVYIRLDKEIKRNGRLCFEQHGRGEYPDHTFWPAALAYAIQNGEFSEEETRSILFDHEQTAETFVEQCGEHDLLEKAFLKLLPSDE